MWNRQDEKSLIDRFYGMNFSRGLTILGNFDFLGINAIRKHEQSC